jgi:hypothetical protein
MQQADVGLGAMLQTTANIENCFFELLRICFEALQNGTSPGAHSCRKTGNFAGLPKTDIDLARSAKFTPPCSAVTRNHEMLRNARRATKRKLRRSIGTNDERRSGPNPKTAPPTLPTDWLVPIARQASIFVGDSSQPGCRAGNPTSSANCLCHHTAKQKQASAPYFILLL